MKKLLILLVIFMMASCQVPNEHTEKAEEITVIDFGGTRNPVYVREYIAPNEETYYIFKTSTGNIEVIPAR